MRLQLTGGASSGKVSSIQETSPNAEAGWASQQVHAVAMDAACQGVAPGKRWG